MSRQRAEQTTADVHVTPEPTMWLPARVTNGSKLANYRPFVSAPCGGTMTTVRWMAVAVLVIAVYGGVGYYEHTRVYDAWTKWIKTPDRYVGEAASVTARLFQYMLVPVFLPLARCPYGLFPYLMGSSFEYLIAMHRLCGDLAIFLGFAHFVTTLAFYGMQHADVAAIVARPRNLTGLFALVAFLLLRLLAFDRVRDFVGHTVFHLSHVVLGLGSLIALSFHWGVARMWYVSAFPIALWVLDLAWRAWRLARGSAVVVARYDLPLSHGAIFDLEMKHGGLTFGPGQWAQLCFPSVSRSEFHPVSLMASSLQSAVAAQREGHIQSESGLAPLRVRVLVRNHGDWSARAVAEPMDRLMAHGAILVGPVGRLMLPTQDCEYIAIVGGGSGLSSALGEAQSLVIARAQSLSSAPSDAAPIIQRPSRVWLLATTQDRDIFVPFQDDIREMSSQPGFTVKCWETGPFTKPYTLETRPAMKGPELEIPIDVGLPNMKAFFEDIAKEATANKISRVPVIVVGPPGQQMAVVKTCVQLNKLYDGVFDFALKPHSWFV